MKDQLSLAFLLIAAALAGIIAQNVKADELDLISITGSYHHDRSTELNEDNDGYAVQHTGESGLVLSAGHYLNSHRHDTSFAGIGQRFYTSRYLRVTGQAWIATGYANSPVPTFGGLAVAPWLGLDVGPRSLHFKVLVNPWVTGYGIATSVRF